MINADKKIEAAGYFTDLPKVIQDVVFELLAECYENETNDLDRGAELAKEEIGCVSRDGFIASPDNRGGIVLRGFTDVGNITGSGCLPSHKGARQQIEETVKNGYDSIAEICFMKFETLLKSKGLDKTSCYYHKIDVLSKADVSLKPVVKYIEDEESTEFNEDTVMYEVRFMYHGAVNGVHRASVSCAVNTEAPYHRSGIPWNPNVFCEGAKEAEIEWVNVNTLKKRLRIALDLTSKAIF